MIKTESKQSCFSAMNPVLLQKQLQENASTLQDFCKDLKNWGEEMKRKEEALINGDNKAANKVDHKKAKKSNSSNMKKETTPKKPATKIGVTDYSAWAKFDADAECEKLEDDINEDSELTDECNDNIQDLAIIEKEKGNKFVKNKKWDEAIKCYTNAIEYYSFDPIFFANRALCHLKKNNFQEAIEDCTSSLKLDNTYVKAYLRRAAAHEGLNMLEHAEYDFMKALELEPKNKESLESLQRLKTKLGRTEKVADQRPVSKFTASRNKSIKTTSLPLPTQSDVKITEFDTSKPVPPWPQEDDIILVKPINKPPHLRSKKPLKRVKIIEKDVDVVINKVEAEKEAEAIKQHVFEKQENLETTKGVTSFKKEIPDVEVNSSVKSASAFKKRQTEKSDHNTAWPKPDEHSLSIKSDDFKIIEKQNSDTSTLTKEVKNTSNLNISNEIKKSDDIKVKNDFVKPKTSVQFNLTWKNLKSSEEKYEYLKLLDPQDLPKMFLNSLESHVFSGILEVLANCFVENKDLVFDILDCFTQVKRFGTFTMFMSGNDKKNLWKLFDYVKGVEQKNKEDVDRLIEKYEL